MVPEDGEPAIRIVHARVVDVQRAAVAQLQIGLRNHPPSVRAVPILFAPKFAESDSLGMLADTLGEQWREGAKTPVPSRSVGYTLRSEGVLEMLYADFGSVGEDTDHVKAQGVVLWSSGVEVGFGYGAQGVLFAGGDGLQWISEARTPPQLDLNEDEGVVLAHYQVDLPAPGSVVALEKFVTVLDQIAQGEVFTPYSGRFILQSPTPV